MLRVVCISPECWAAPHQLPLLQCVAGCKLRKCTLRQQGGGQLDWQLHWGPQGATKGPRWLQQARTLHVKGIGAWSGGFTGCPPRGDRALASWTGSCSRAPAGPPKGPSSAWERTSRLLQLARDATPTGFLGNLGADLALQGCTLTVRPVPSLSSLRGTAWRPSGSYSATKLEDKVPPKAWAQPAWQSQRPGAADPGQRRSAAAAVAAERCTDAGCSAACGGLQCSRPPDSTGIQRTLREEGDHCGWLAMLLWSQSSASGAPYLALQGGP